MIDYDTPAKPGTIYVCGACGKTCKTRGGFREHSCSVWAVLCVESSLQFDPRTNLVVAGKAVDP